MRKKYRNPKKESDLFSMLDYQREVACTLKGINKLNEIIDWEVFRNGLEALLGYDRQDSTKEGMPSFDPVLMLKNLFMIF